MKMTAGAERDGAEFTRRGYPTWSHTLFSSAATATTTTTTILGIRYAGPPSSRADKQSRCFARRRACASYRNAADNADLKNYAATHRSSLSRGTAGELEKGPTGRTGCICLVLSGRGCRVHASFTLVETNGGRYLSEIWDEN